MNRICTQTVILFSSFFRILLASKTDLTWVLVPGHLLLVMNSGVLVSNKLSLQDTLGA